MVLLFSFFVVAGDGNGRRIPLLTEWKMRFFTDGPEGLYSKGNVAPLHFFNLNFHMKKITIFLFWAI